MKTLLCMVLFATGLIQLSYAGNAQAANLCIDAKGNLSYYQSLLRGYNDDIAGLERALREDNEILYDKPIPLSEVELVRNDVAEIEITLVHQREARDGVEKKILRFSQDVKRECRE